MLGDELDHLAAEIVDIVARLLDGCGRRGADFDDGGLHFCFYAPVEQELAAASISVWIWERRSRETGLTVWYSSSMPMLNVGCMFRLYLVTLSGPIALRRYSCMRGGGLRQGDSRL